MSELAHIHPEQQISRPQTDDYELARPGSLREELPVHTLRRGDVVAVGADAASLYSPGDIGLPLAGYHSVIGEVRLGGNHDKVAAIVRERRNGESSFTVYGLQPDRAGKLVAGDHAVALRNDSPLIIGRDGVQDPDSATYLWDDTDERISRQHVSVTLRGGEISIADNSMNGTQVAGRKIADSAPVGSDPHMAEHTIRSLNEVGRLFGNVEHRAAEQYIDGRVVVGRDTIIDETRPAIDIRSFVGGGESIVVDSHKYPKEFNLLRARYNTVRETIRQHGGQGELATLQAIYDSIDQSMEYDLAAVEAEEAIAAQASPNGMRKLALNRFMEQYNPATHSWERGRAVCRHMALAAAWLGGELKRTGQLQGSMTAEVNQRNSDNAAHEWARYTAPDGSVYIIDPAQQYVGRLEDSLRLKAWEYFRPNERAQYEAKLARDNGAMIIDPEAVVLSDRARNLRRRSR